MFYYCIHSCDWSCWHRRRLKQLYLIVRIRWLADVVSRVSREQSNQPIELLVHLECMRDRSGGGFAKEFAATGYFLAFSKPTDEFVPLFLFSFLVVHYSHDFVFCVAPVATSARHLGLDVFLARHAMSQY